MTSLYLGLTLKTLCNELGRVRKKWFQIGIQLGIPHHVLEGFEKGNDPLSAVINYFLRGNTMEPVAWKTIEKALKSEAVGEPALAKQINKKYCQHESETKKGLCYSQ